MYERSRSERPDEDPDRDFADRAVKLATTFGGAGVVHGDLTPECAEMVGRVLDALGAPAGDGDDRTREQRHHDALAEAMRPLCFCVMLDSCDDIQADRAEAQLRAGLYAPSERDLRRGGVGADPA